MAKYQIYNEDCIQGAKKIKDKSVDLCIFDPPFGINETSFGKHYKRKEHNVLGGYQEAPEDYLTFTTQWLDEAKKILRDDGSMYIISGWTNLGDVLLAVENLDLYIRNHIIWKFNFGVNTSNKWVTSHYSILYVTKFKKARPIFNKYCRFGPQEKDDNGGSLLYQDIEDVWHIKKEYQPNTAKNKNKLPDELIRKIILYSSKKNNLVCDFFMGNFTTANIALRLGRRVIGFETNKEVYNYHMKHLDDIEFGCELTNLKKVKIEKPKNQGKPLDDDTRVNIKKDFIEMIDNGLSKKDSISKICEKYQRGRFSIINIVQNIPINQRKHLNGDKEKIIEDAAILMEQGRRRVDICKILASKYHRSAKSIEHLLRGCL